MEVRTTVVVLTDLTGRGVALVEEGLGGLVEGVGKYACLSVSVRIELVAEGLSQSKELAQGIPAQVVFFLNLLNVLRSGSACTGLEEAAASHQRNHRQHLCGGAELENWEQVGVVVTQHVAGDGDGVFALTDALDGDLGCLDRGGDGDIQALGVVVLEVLLNQGGDVAVVCALRVQPEDGLHAGKASAVNSQLDPILDRSILGLASAPDVACLDVVLDEDVASGVSQLHGAVLRHLEGLVVGAVLLSLLSHQADVRNGTHGGRIESAIRLAIIDNCLVDASVRRIRDDSQGVLLFIILVPHVAGGADHGRHGSVDDDVRWDVQVADALSGVDHSQVRTIFESSVECGLDLFAILEGVQALVDSAKAVLAIETSGLKLLAVLCKDISEVSAHNVAEDDRVRDLHHGGLQVSREENALFLSACNLSLQELIQSLCGNEGAVNNLAL